MGLWPLVSGASGGPWTPVLIFGDRYRDGHAAHEAAVALRHHRPHEVFDVLLVAAVVVLARKGENMKLRTTYQLNITRMDSQLIICK